MNIKSDYSYLFQSMNVGSGANKTTGYGNFFSDYASIKNGSYSKLLKAYYKGSSSDEVKTLATKKEKSLDQEKSINKMQAASDSLKTSAERLLDTSSKSVFAQKDVSSKDAEGNAVTTKAYDKEGIYKAVDEFVANYNKVIKASGDVSSKSIYGKVENMANQAIVSSKSLSDIGISINSDSTLSINKDSFMNADMDTVKKVFQGNGSFGYRTSVQASMVNYSAEHEVARKNMYNQNGNAMNSSIGNLYNGFI